MEVVDGLTAVRAGVDDQAVAAGEVLLPGDEGRGGEQLAEPWGFGGRGVGERGDVLLRDKENVRRCLGADVWEGQDVLVLIEARDGDCAGGNFAEEAVRQSVGS